MKEAFGNWATEFSDKLMKTSSKNLNSGATMLVDALKQSLEDPAPLRNHKQQVIANVIRTHARYVLPSISGKNITALADPSYPRVRRVVVDMSEAFLRGLDMGGTISIPGNFAALVNVVKSSGVDPFAIMGHPKGRPSSPASLRKVAAAHRREATRPARRGPKPSGPRR